jgi:hypothetical protein
LLFNYNLVNILKFALSMTFSLSLGSGLGLFDFALRLNDLGFLLRNRPENAFFGTEYGASTGLFPGFNDTLRGLLEVLFLDWLRLNIRLCSCLGLGPGLRFLDTGRSCSALLAVYCLII